MPNSMIYKKYDSLFQELNNLVIKTNDKVIGDTIDEFIMDNINFYNKSFIVVLCAYLESFLKEKCYEVVALINDRLNSTFIPNNIVNWSIIKSKYKDIDYSNFKLNISTKDIDDEISGNISKTIDMFKKLGVDLRSSGTFEANKDLIANIVLKRNNIVHHNDEASDLTFNDIKNYIDTIKIYICDIDTVVKNSLGISY